MTPEEKAAELGVPLVGGDSAPAPKVIAICRACGTEITEDRARSGPCRMIGCPIHYGGVVMGLDPTPHPAWPGALPNSKPRTR